ncbi:hypothetical protein ACN4EG_20800, partial [Alkalinema pantanalense CENA528]|uniref:hypothetical protein n=1 Tax=Alkalinema pantanalense TaxID=1620705 RepID=UPI003D6F62CD
NLVFPILLLSGLFFLFRRPTNIAAAPGRSAAAQSSHLRLSGGCENINGSTIPECNAIRENSNTGNNTSS